MFNIQCNLNKDERIRYAVIGAVLLLGGLVGFGKWFLIIIGVALLIEGAVGWCGIPVAIAKIKEKIQSK